jgi:hypothetical protein
VSNDADAIDLMNEVTRLKEQNRALRDALRELLESVADVVDEPADLLAFGRATDAARAALAACEPRERRR